MISESLEMEIKKIVNELKEISKEKFDYILKRSVDVILPEFCTKLTSYVNTIRIS